MFPDETPESPMFASQNQGDRDRVVESRPFLCSGWINPHNPNATSFHFLDGSDKILHTNNRKIGGRSSRCPNDRRCKRRSVAFRHHNTRRTTCFRSSHDRAEIVWVFYTVKQDNDRLLRFKQRIEI